MKNERTEGWGTIINSRKAHYFREDRSICGGWLALGGPRWEPNQEMGDKPTIGDCKACWTKRTKEIAGQCSAITERSNGKA